VNRSLTPADRRASVGAATFAASLAAMVAQMSLTGQVPLLGLFQEELGASAANLTWLTAAIFIPTAVLELNFGVLGDLFGRRRLIIGGQLVCVFGLVLFYFADSVTMVAVVAVLLGLGAAALLPSTLATVAALSPTPEERAKAIARWALAIALASALSPLFAGLLGQEIGLHAAWTVTLVLAVVGAAFSYVAVPDTSAPEGRALDWRGQVLSGIGLLALMYAIIQGADQGWASTSVVIAYIVAAVALAAFVVAELKHGAPMFQVRLLKIPAFRAAALAGLVGMLSFIGFAYSMAVKLGPINHKGPLSLAIPFVVMQIVPLALGPFLGRILHRVSPRSLLVAGLLVMAAGEIWYIRLDAYSYSLGDLTGPIVLVGIGFLMMFASVTAAAVNSVPHDAVGMAAGATSLVRETGQTLGAAVVSAIALTRASTLIVSGIHSAPLPPEAVGMVEGINQQAGGLAVVNASAAPDFPAPIGQVVNPIAHRALDSGFDLGITVLALLTIATAGVVAVTMRGAAARPVTAFDELETEGGIKALA
jgi:MFS family permease